jgi:hypothetical protein
MSPKSLKPGRLYVDTLGVTTLYNTEYVMVGFIKKNEPFLFLGFESNTDISALTGKILYKEKYFRLFFHPNAFYTCLKELKNEI